MKKLKGFFKKLCADRKGAAMEMAIMLLIVTFSLSTLVLSTSLLQYTRQLRAGEEMVRSIELEQIGETFCTAVSESAEHTWINRYPDYDIAVDALTLTVTDPESGSILLTVELTEQDGKYTVTQWSKS